MRAARSGSAGVRSEGWLRPLARGRSPRQADVDRVPYGSLTDGPTLKPTAHMFVGSKAPWFEILDDLPQYDEYPWS